MEILVLAVVLFPVLFLVLFVVVLRGVNTASRRSEANAPHLLDEAFAGRDPVTYTVSLGTLPFERVVIGARERGYRLDSQSGSDRYGTQTLVFARNAQS